MTGPGQGPVARGLRWLRSRDAGLLALRRSGRAAIVMPGLLALSFKVIGNPVMATFAAFGSLSMLLFVAFGGRMRERLPDQTALILTGAVFVCLGTLASRAAWLAALAMLIVGFFVLFAGVVSSALASASTSLLLAFVLPVSLRGPVSSIPDRLAGWLLAGAASLLAITLLWPAPARDPLRRPLVQACTALAARLRAEAGFARVAHGDRAALESARTRLETATAEANSAVSSLRTSFFATPYRPTGLTTAARALVRLVDECIWLQAVMDQMPSTGHSFSQEVCAVKVAAADLLEQGTALLDAGHGPLDSLQPGLDRLEQARDTMENAAMSLVGVGAGPDGEAEQYVSGLEPSFRGQELSFVTSAITTNIGVSVAALERPWWQQLLGRQPAGASGTLSSVQERAGAHVQPHSVWLHNSIRGAIALALAVLVSDLIGVQHSFWVVLGTLSVLRSSAFSTGQNVLRGLLGTLAGFVIGGLLVVAIGTNETVLWILLPIAVLVAGLAPAVISFAAGQASFTITLLILYNIIAPAGWKVGLVRIEDVAIGCGVSLVVGALFWPRGAASALGTALAGAYAETARYLSSAVTYGVLRCDEMLPPAPPPRDQSLRAAAAARRLDDAFRSYLAESGTKHLPLPEVTTLLTGVTVLRLSADAVVDLWSRDDGRPSGDRTAARTEVLAAAGQVTAWYQAMADALTGSGPVPAELPPDAAADGRLTNAVRHDLTGEDGQGTVIAVKMIWTADHIAVARRLQGRITGPVRTAAGIRQRTQRLFPAGRRRATEPSAVTPG
ncbi:MAG TPA: FUSC family protein [Streptosporangiaceae bacterium]